MAVARVVQHVDAERHKPAHRAGRRARRAKAEARPDARVAEGRTQQRDLGARVERLERSPAEDERRAVDVPDPHDRQRRLGRRRPRLLRRTLHCQTTWNYGVDTICDGQEASAQPIREKRVVVVCTRRTFSDLQCTN